MQTQSWQAALSDVITDPRELLELLDLDLALLPAAQNAAKLFPLRVPRGFVARMRPGDSRDPLLQQVLPLGIELKSTAGYSADPLQEKNTNPIPGLLHKYHGRVLLTITGACAVNCRYCFRRSFPYAENNPGREGWDKALAYISSDSTISEVILSGGDPLVASDKYLAALCEKIAAIPHVNILRVHSRTPIVLPERITDGLVAWFSTSRLRPVLVVHTNHPHEIDAQVAAALRALKQRGITLLNQSVLLKGINDSVDTLVQLSEKLFSAGILPYYLHLPDKVQGTAHFDVDETAAQQLVWSITKRLPGYLVPKLVREVPGVPAKVPSLLAV